MIAPAQLLGWFLLAAAASLACGSSKPAPTPRLVVLYATCTLNKHYLSPYDSSVSYTPNLDAFAKRGTVFRRHQTESGLSGVAFASILSGSDATGHGIFSHPTRMDDSVTLITEAFANAGWDVYFWADHAMASPALNYAQGVDEANVFQIEVRRGYPDPRRPHPEGFLRGDDPRLQRILEGLHADPEKRALLVTNFTVTHAPYSAAWLGEFCEEHPGECEDLPAHEFDQGAELLWNHYVDLSWNFEHTREKLGLTPDDVRRLASSAERLYKANVARLDRLFGDVLDAIENSGLQDVSAVAFTSDHGEVLRREGAPFQWNHGFALAPEVLGVPWILSAPGLEPGSFEGVTRSIDLFPTLAGLARVPVASDRVTGVDLGPALRGNEPVPVLQAFSHTALVPEILLKRSRQRGGTRLDALHSDRSPDRIWVSMRDGDRVYKLTRFGDAGFEPALYDLGRDPGESMNLYDPTDPRQRAAIEHLEAYRMRLVQALSESEARTPLPAGRERSLLRELGYIE